MIIGYWVTVVVVQVLGSHRIPRETQVSLGNPAPDGYAHMVTLGRCQARSFTAYLSTYSQIYGHSPVFFCSSDYRTLWSMKVGPCQRNIHIVMDLVQFVCPHVGDVYNSEPFLTFAFTYTSNLAKPMLKHVVRRPKTCVACLPSGSKYPTILYLPKTCTITTITQYPGA